MESVAKKGNVTIIGKAVAKKEKRSGLILLSPKVGDYTSLLHSAFKTINGDELDFFCPLCHSSLVALDVSEKLVRIIMIDENSEKHELFFSGVAGEHCTFVISDKKFEEFGNDSEKYSKFFKTRRI